MIQKMMNGKLHRYENSMRVGVHGFHVVELTVLFCNATVFEISQGQK